MVVDVGERTTVTPGNGEGVTILQKCGLGSFAKSGLRCDLQSAPKHGSRDERIEGNNLERYES